MGEIKHWLDALAERHARVPDELAMIELARAELRELEDCRLIVRAMHLVHAYCDFDVDKLPGYQQLSADERWDAAEAIDTPIRKLTDEQRAALVKACGETV